jgi:hypothetical protein
MYDEKSCHIFWQRLDPGDRSHFDVAGEAKLPEVALLVGQFGRQGAAVQIEDTVVGIAGVVFRHAIDQRRAYIRSRALHDERNVLVGDALQGDQRFRRLQFVVERHDLKFLA